jgi:predicted Zn-dependent protease
MAAKSRMEKYKNEIEKFDFERCIYKISMEIDKILTYLKKVKSATMHFITLLKMLLIRIYFVFGNKVLVSIFLCE